MSKCSSHPCKILKLAIDYLRSQHLFIRMLYWFSPADSWTTAICGCFNCVCERVCARGEAAQPASVQHMALAAPRSLLIRLTRCSRHPPRRLLSTFHSREGERSFCFSAPATRLLLQPDSFAHLLSPLTKSLFRLDAAENHMACDITGAGSEEKGNGRGLWRRRGVGGVGGGS